MGAVPIDDLKGWQLFSYLSPRDLAQLAAIGSLETYRKGHAIFTEGDPADALWVLLKGQVKINKVGPDGREQVLRIVRAGESFAEAAALARGAFPAGAAATARSTTARFPADDFLRLLEASPQLATNMIVALSQLLRGFAALVDALALRDVPSRLAKYLLDASLRARSDTVVLEVSKTVLAARLGTVSETLSRALRRLREQGLIVVDGQRIDILDRESLQRVAAGLS
ncbi:MAG: Crp/Fnr family transcriptional regulator [Armatimonadetes bacterium]|nr:Crp/Fnr family transcriptional regulator [Armatimonadota bacterium]